MMHKYIFTLALMIMSANAAIFEDHSIRRLKKGKTTKSSKSSKKSKSTKPSKNKKAKYEVWAADQSNSVAGQTSLGVKGSFLSIYGSNGIEKQLNGRGDAIPLSCTPEKTQGPCNVFDIFPSNLVESSTGKVLGELPGFGRLHGTRVDPQNKYVNLNFFAVGGAYVGIVDVETKEAVALFRLSEFNTSKKRSVHMSTWSVDGSSILCANLHGKATERINIGRDDTATITSIEFDRSATIAFGSNNEITEEATVFQGNNAFGRPLLGSIIGDYVNADLGDLTPNGFCKEDGCGTSNFPDVGRGNNVPICPVTASGGVSYTNFGGGGLFVLNFTATPISIIREYDRQTLNGAGCGGTQAEQQMFLNAGVSASSAGITQSTFSVYSFDNNVVSSNVPNTANEPAPFVLFKDPTNTNTIGNVDGTDIPNNTGQIPGETTRRDSHGMALAGNGKYLHVLDRIQNVVEVFDVDSYERFSYDLTSKNGKSGRPEDPMEAGACFAKSVIDDTNLVANDPTPDIGGISPDGKFIFTALRGPAPVSVSHGAQGSCPGVGIIEVTEGGKSGKLVDVIRTSNTIDNVPVPSIPGGVQYTGAERSDIHDVVVVRRE